jgi:hypothetical protein
MITFLGTILLHKLNFLGPLYSGPFDDHINFLVELAPSNCTLYFFPHYILVSEMLYFLDAPQLLVLSAYQININLKLAS